MSSERGGVARTADAVDLVPGRAGAWVPVPQRPAARAVQAWVRRCVHPAPPEQYLGSAEVCLIRTRRHWIVPLKRLAQAGMMLPLSILATLLVAFVLPGAWWLQVAMWLGTVAHQLYIAYLVVAWRVDELIVTDRRLIRVHGVFTTTIDAMNLSQITDTSYHQSLVGHALGYGSIRVESAGQTQSLERIDLVPDPGAIYRATLA